MNKLNYKKNDFKILKLNNNIRFFIKAKNSYIEINEKVYKIIKNNNDKERYYIKKEAEKHVIYIDNMAYSASFILYDNNIHNLLIKDAYKIVIKEINRLSERDKRIAEYIFLKEYSDRETSKLLDIPQTTVTYRKNKIRKILKEKLLKYCSFEDLFQQ